MRSLLLALLLIVAGVPRAKSQAAGDSSKGSIQGSVVDAKTGQPLRGADVSLRALGTGGRGDQNSATSDSDGRFIFENLPPGRYWLNASRNGYFYSGRRSGGGMRGDILSLSSGQHLDGIILRLTPAAIIAGRVIAEGDEPIPNVFVQAVKYAYQGGKRRLSDFGTSTTNDRGEYRIWGLPPGRYYIRATHPRAGTSRPGSPAYIPIFYPNVSDPAKTQPIDLHSGDEVTGIDLTLASLHSVRLAGKVVNDASLPAKNAQVSLVGGLGSMTFSLGQTSADAKGGFEINGVPAGSYTLIAEQFGGNDTDKVMRGRISIEVGESNLNDLEVVVGSGATLAGHVHVEGKTPTDLSKLTVELDAQDDLSSLGFTPDVNTASVGADGTFSFHGVPEGFYLIDVRPLPDGFYLKPAAEGDPAETGVKVGRNHSAAVELTLSSGAARLAGTVSKDQLPAAGAVVVLVPDQPRRGAARLYRQALSGPSGKFTISSITPGDYKIFAWEQIERGVYLDPDFIQAYEDSGKPLHVEEGSTLSIQLEIIPAN